MPFETALFTLLHVLVFVYWLGGDLGAFYSSRFLIAPDISTERRLLAAKTVNDVDMAPRTALILTLPTGLLLAIYSHWVRWPLWTGWLVAAMSLVWLGIAWRVHLSHNTPSLGLKRIDLAIRFGLISGLSGVAIGSLIGPVELPFFLALKMLLLAGAIVMGLLIRRVLVPLGPALGSLTGPDSDAAQKSLADTLRRARPLVTIIWMLILCAAFIGIWKPVWPGLS